MEDLSPAEVARETLRQLASRKVAPTPDNYAAIYREIAHAPDPMVDIGSAFAARLEELRLVDSVARRDCARWIESGSWSKALDALASGLDRREKTQAAYAANARPEPSAPRGPRFGELVGAMRELNHQIATMVDAMLPALGSDDPRIQAEGQALSEFCRNNPDAGEISLLKARLSQFNLRLSFVGEDQKQIKSTALAMLRGVIRNLGAITPDDRWLREQVEILSACATPPLLPRRLEEAASRLEDVIAKQSELKRKTKESQHEMKTLLATFLEKLSAMSDFSSIHHQRIEACAKRVEQARELSDISPALAEAIAATRQLADAAMESRDELSDLRRKSEDAAALAATLRRDLDAATHLARHDALTGALNRKGMQETIERELGRSRRHGSPLSVAFLDIDNFKSINDAHGHHAGDAALALLARVARESMRPQDTLSRYGGEEFIVIMPDTDCNGGVMAMARLQRELTRRFFLAGENKLLITFSAGVAEVEAGEEASKAIERADMAMLQAKQAGRNKVLPAAPSA